MAEHGRRSTEETAPLKELETQEDIQSRFLDSGVRINTDTTNNLHLMGRQSNTQLQLKLKNRAKKI